MRYPSEILPNANYKLINCDLSSFYLIRFTHSNIRSDIFDDTVNQVRQTQIVDPSKGMDDLSTNLLGIFTPDHIQIKLTDLGKSKYNEYCEPDAVVATPISDLDYTWLTSRGFWVVLVGDINAITADYTKGDIDTKFKATCVIEHMPMKWNYWHFSIRWETEDLGFWHKLNDNQKKKLAKRLGHEARANIAMFAKIEQPEYPVISEVNFLKA